MDMKRLAPAWAVKALLVFVFASILFRCVSATNHTVGGTSGWDLASDMQNWSFKRTFYTGDYLVFMYGPTHDVLEVDQQAFATCQISNPMTTYNDGNTVLKLAIAGTRYFICGTSGHCSLGMRLQVNVLPRPDSTRGRRRRTPPPTRSPPPALRRSPAPPNRTAPPGPPPHQHHRTALFPPSPDDSFPSQNTGSGSRVRIAGLLSLLPLLLPFS